MNRTVEIVEKVKAAISDGRAEAFATGRESLSEYLSAKAALAALSIPDLELLIELKRAAGVVAEEREDA